MSLIILIGFVLFIVIAFTSHLKHRRALQALIGEAGSRTSDTSTSTSSSDSSPFPPASNNEHMIAHYNLNPHERSLVENHGMDPHHVGAMHIHEQHRAMHESMHQSATASTDIGVLTSDPTKPSGDGSI